VPYKIVVADPGPSVQKAVQLAFPEPEFRLFFIEDGARLAEAVAEIGPDTVLLSLSLPGTDAYAAARSLGRLEALRNVPLFLLKGTFELVDRDKAEGIPLEAVIQKPFDSEKLAATVRDAIDRKISPQTMPEEPLPEEPAAEQPPASPAPGAASLRRPGPGSPGADALRTQVRELVSEEVLEMERELEKRIRARILAELGKEP
jgi:DNA-binding response OmpR family regulator